MSWFNSLATSKQIIVGLAVLVVLVPVIYNLGYYAGQYLARTGG